MGVGIPLRGTHVDIQQSAIIVHFDHSPVSVITILGSQRRRTLREIVEIDVQDFSIDVKIKQSPVASMVSASRGVDFKKIAPKMGACGVHSILVVAVQIYYIFLRFFNFPSNPRIVKHLKYRNFTTNLNYAGYVWIQTKLARNFAKPLFSKEVRKNHPEKVKSLIDTF